MNFLRAFLCPLRFQSLLSRAEREKIAEHFRYFWPLVIVFLWALHARPK